MELNPDWNEKREAMAAAADEAVEAAAVAGGVGPGVAGDPKEVISVPLCWPPDPLLLWPPTRLTEPPFPLLSVAPVEVKPAPPLELPSGTPTPLPLLPPPPVEDPPELPLSRFWFRNFSSRRHLARRFENQTYHN